MKNTYDNSELNNLMISKLPGILDNNYDEECDFFSVSFKEIGFKNVVADEIFCLLFDDEVSVFVSFNLADGIDELPYKEVNQINIDANYFKAYIVQNDEVNSINLEATLHLPESTEGAFRWVRDAYLSLTLDNALIDLISKLESFVE